MRKLQFSGYSDDTFGLINDIELDFDNCGDCTPIVFKIFSSSESNGLLIGGQYYPKNFNGWTIMVSPLLDVEDYETVMWKQTLYFDSTLSKNIILEIEVPDDTTITCLLMSDNEDMFDMDDD